MTLDLQDCTVSGPALTEPFLRFELAGELERRKLLRPPGPGWDRVARQLRALGSAGGPVRVANHVVAPLAPDLGYAPPARQDPVTTREGPEDGGWLLQTPAGTRLRSWAVGVGTDLDTPHRNGRAYRFSPGRSAQRVLRAAGERAGLLTDGTTLRLLLNDPARPDSHLEIALAGHTGWRAQTRAPDSYRALMALAGPPGLAALPAILDAARLSQTRITTGLRTQARAAIEGFLQAVLDHPANTALPRDPGLPATLWTEALVLVYRLLFILKLESAADPARAFSFAATPLWRSALSPNQALGPVVRRHLDQGQDTGRLLEDGLRAAFRLFRDGLTCSELAIAPLGGALFGPDTTPRLDALTWGEHAVALLLDRLLWTRPAAGPRARIHYGALDVEDLGRVYEALLDLEPGIADRPMLRLRRARAEAVVPAAALRDATDSVTEVEAIPPGRFFLRAGLGRKATGAFYTPHDLVRYLVRETLAPLVAERSPEDDPQPAAILALKLLDPATGSGHFLVEACRFLGEALYAACRLCDELATAAECTDTPPLERARLLARAATLRARVGDLPDPDRSLLAYLPSRVREGGGSGVSQSHARAICRRLVAVHCLYGVDRNPLAVELAKLSLWLESYAEGLPLTFLDHRLLAGDSLAGPFLADLATLPVGRLPLDPLLAGDVAMRLRAAHDAAVTEIRALDATVGRDIADLALKQAAAQRLSAALTPLDRLAQAWAGAVMLAARDSDDAWLGLAQTVADTGAFPARLTPVQAALCETGAEALSFDLAFPDVFAQGGFDAVLGNPPWGVLQPLTKDFVAGFDPGVLDAPTKAERAAIEARVLADPATAEAFRRYKAGFTQQKALADRLFHHQSVTLGRDPTAGNQDTYRLFAERAVQLAGPAGAIGLLLPSAFHANEGSTGVRRLYLDATHWEACLSFENRRKLFDIDSRFKFALILARRPGPTEAVRCAFYLDGLADLEAPARTMRYDRAFLVSGGPHLAPLELRGEADLTLARTLFAAPHTLGDWCRSRGIGFGCDLHMTADSGLFVPLGRRLPAGTLPMHEGKTFHQFTDTWTTAPRYAVAQQALSPRTALAASHYRVAFRDVARSSDEHTMIAMLAAPGVVFGHTATVERTLEQRPAAAALLLCALLNSHVLDWLARQKAAAHLSLYLVASLPVPAFSVEDTAFLVRGALQLSCNHAGYARLWREETGTPWQGSWPMVAGGAERWQLRAAMDAVIAHAYGLTRAQYACVLASFSHKSFPDAPGLCLAAFDRRTRCQRTDDGQAPRPS
ncbi:MAG: hypothetical protein P4L71_16780 [Acetobacteraceae bacterium]|nr:hypothetical protein [Acetobacteraceae bacterium]